jgi:hypothetical protein
MLHRREQRLLLVGPYGMFAKRNSYSAPTVNHAYKRLAHALMTQALLPFKASPSSSIDLRYLLAFSLIWDGCPALPPKRRQSSVCTACAVCSRIFRLVVVCFRVALIVDCFCAGEYWITGNDGSFFRAFQYVAVGDLNGDIAGRLALSLLILRAGDSRGGRTLSEELLWSEDEEEEFS